MATCMNMRGISIPDNMQFAQFTTLESKAIKGQEKVDETSRHIVTKQLQTWGMSELRRQEPWSVVQR